MDPLENMEPELILLLHTYKKVFDKTSGLLLNRLEDHVIPLLDTNLNKVRPYHYPYSQKAQMKQIVKEMLEEDFI